MRSPSALTAFLACRHLAALQLAVARGDLAVRRRMTLRPI